MKLCEIIEGLEPTVVNGREDTDILGIAYDSRKVREGYLFVCIEGTLTDGHRYVPQALENGAAAILAQKAIGSPPRVTVVRTDNTRYGLAHVSDRFFGHPSGKFNLVGVTGTKGKTTTTYMIKSILESMKQKIGLVGTVEKLISDRVIYMERTTRNRTTSSPFSAKWRQTAWIRRLWKFLRRGSSCTGWVAAILISGCLQTYQGPI